MQTARLTWAGILLATAIGVAPAAAAPFKCPKVGGTFTFGQEANVNSLDMMTSSAISTRNIAMNVFETLVTRDEGSSPIPELADSITEAPDGLSYTFKLRQGVKFHNGKTLSSADVLASYERYKKVSIQRNTLDNVDHWDVPDASTFIIHLKQAQPTFIVQLSSFAVPIVIIPAENRDDPVQQLKTVGTGPWQLVESVPGSQVTVKRFDDYSPNTHYEDKTGFGGYKQACFDRVVFRVVTEPGARLAGVQTGELQGVEDLPTKSLGALEVGPAHHVDPAAELVDPDRVSQHLGAADRQFEFPQGGAGGVEHGRDHGCRDRRELSAECRVPVSESAVLYRCGQGDV